MAALTLLLTLPGTPAGARTADTLPWGLDRIDQRAPELDGVYRASADGTGVTVYVVDSGLLASHEQFTGRVRPGFTTVDDGGGTSDCVGHGTHVTGTLAGTSYGVAPGVTVRPVRILGCDGVLRIASLVEALAWVRSEVDGPSVVNVSLGRGHSQRVDTAVRDLVAAGVSVVVSAGNSGEDACGQSPARVDEAITVGATNRRDARAPFSNLGPCVDLYAPGVGIRSAWWLSNTDSRVEGGTSMAAPHVAGVAALYLQHHPCAAPARVARALVSAATAVGRHRLLAYSGLPALADPPLGRPVCNPGFERGDIGWASSPGVIADGAASLVASGDGAWLRQTFRVPDGAAPVVRFAAATEPGGAGDVLRLEVTTAAGTRTLRTWDDAGPAGEVSVALGDDLVGQVVTLAFRANGPGATAYRIDDVVVSATAARVRPGPLIDVR